MQSTFEQLKAKVFPALVNYKDDLLKHDFAILAEYDGPFLYAYRPTGTDLVRMFPNWDSYSFHDYATPEQQEESIRGAIIFITYKDRNKHFAYFDGQHLQFGITAEKAQQIYTNHCNKIFAQRDRKLEPSF